MAGKKTQEFIDPGLPWPIEMLSPGRLRPDSRNARTHSKKQIRQIADSMLRFGITNPVIIDAKGQLVAGHARAEAAKLANIRQIPAIRLSHLSDAEIRAYMLADNRLAEGGGWDREILAAELGELEIALPKIGLDLEITGFSAADVDSILQDLAPSGHQAADQLPDVQPKAIARMGELFDLGQHRLLVGDARNPGGYADLLGSAAAVWLSLMFPTM